MNIYTSNFRNLKNIPGDMTAISVARFPPKWYQGHELKSLAPSPKLLGKAKSGKINNDDYTKEYLSALEAAFSPESLYEILTRFAGDGDIVLLCFEKPGDFCHRRLVARWLERHLNIRVDEF